MSSPAPACRQGLLDATRRWPQRRTDSDGIMGDARHQKRPSDHNLGNAFDVGHDPASGCAGGIIAAAAILDSRVTYVIWNRHIYNRTHKNPVWRAYHGENPHTHHCHISISAASRNDTHAWGWAPGAALPSAIGAAAEAAAPAAGHGHAAEAHPHAAHPHESAREPARVSSRRPFPGVLRRGTRSAGVLQIQTQLGTYHWRVAVDGIFGAETERAVRGFQKRHELIDDGLVGARTWRALFP